MINRLSRLAAFTLVLGCTVPLIASQQPVEPQASPSPSSDGIYDTNFSAGDCRFMIMYSKALADAGIDHKVELDGSISYREEDDDAVQSVELDPSWLEIDC